MAATASLKLTVDDYLALPEDGRRYQLIDGDLVMAPAPLRYHQRILVRLTYVIMDHLEAHPQGELNIAPFDVHLDKHNVFQPDLCWFSEERRNFLAGPVHPHTFVMLNLFQHPSLLSTGCS